MRPKKATRGTRPKTARIPARTTSALRTASRAVALTDELRRSTPVRFDRAIDPRVRAWAALRIEELDGDFGQAIADGAVDDARRRLERRIRAHMPPASLEVTITDNRYTMISVRRDPKRRQYRLRLHHMFADASPNVARALASYVAHNDRDASTVLSAFIDAHQHRVAPRRTRRRPHRIVTEGDFHDLQDIFDELNARYFDGAIDARITWGPRTRSTRRRNSIKMGSYSVEEKLIRLHRTLDRPFVPRFFVAWIVYHEMLHQVHEAPLVAGRRRFHTPAFNADEARFHRYDEARTWERDNLDRLLSY